ncbi:hypothetical protein EDC56_1147 [Sinobacterium caligoides]|uniref:Transmembrane protein n=1 Tax=Sinobacterium caligoides TaxID=933926 RepID=A0A3N2E0G5_9GAMM|nr:hypothetical protein [Sinobacterium caligoides]ROS05601.1 hypothetical protein EDC56_1147 [Sinobacterium caligoides]
MEIKQKNVGKNQTVINNESGVVNVDQSRQYTNLADENTLHIYKEISQADQGKFITGFVIACFLPGLSLIADFMQMHPVIDFPFWVYLVAFGTIFFVVLIGFFDNFKIMSSEPPRDDECRWLYSDRLFIRTENGYTIFTHTNNCIYPDCQGKIVISSPPERYNGEFSCFGKCSLAGGQHSYGIDYNFKAYPIDVDWRPIPRPNK